MKKTLLYTASSLTALSFILSGCGGSDPHASHAVSLPAAQVETGVVETGMLSRHTPVTGTLRARERASLAPKLTGEIVEMPVILGQSVAKGDLLAKVSAMEIASKLQQAQAGYDKARRDLQREEGLLKSGASTQELVNDLSDQLRMAKAATEEAETMLSYTEIRAPFDGVITRKWMNEGDLATPGRPLVDIDNLGSLRIEADVPEALGSRLQVGLQMEVEIPSAGLRMKGEIEEIAPAADPQSRTFPVKMAISQEPSLRSGQFARVLVPNDPVEAVWVPESALSRWGQIERVFVVEDGKLRMRIVKTGSVIDGKVEVLSGLRGGETMVLKPDHTLRDGQPVGNS